MRRKLGKYYIYNTITLDNLRYFRRVTYYIGIEFVLTGGMAVQAYLYSNGIHPSRATGDLDIIIDKEDKEKFLTKLLPTMKGVDVKYRKTKIIDSVLIYFPRGPYFSISFTDKLPLKTEVNVKTVTIPVELLEYLLANKIRTYLLRREDRDVIDILDLVKLLFLGRYKVDSQVFQNALEFYSLNLEDIPEKIREIIATVPQVR